MTGDNIYSILPKFAKAGFRAGLIEDLQEANENAHKLYEEIYIIDI